MKKKFTPKQLEVMKILWDSDESLIASRIVELNDSLNLNTVQACLRALVKMKAIKVADIVYSGTVLCRSYAPVVTKEEYFAQTYGDLAEKEHSVSLMAALIDTKTDLEELEQLETLIAQRKKAIRAGKK